MDLFFATGDLCCEPFLKTTVLVHFTVWSVADTGGPVFGGDAQLLTPCAPELVDLGLQLVSSGVYFGDPGHKLKLSLPGVPDGRHPNACSHTLDIHQKN